MRTLRQHPARPGKVLVLFVLLLTVLLGMLGLVADGGMMMAAHRQTQNAADSAALAAALDLMRGGGSATATASATTFVQTHNGLTGATVTVNIPPAAPSPYAGNPQFVEVIVNRPYSTMFAHANGANQSQTVSARAVAGFEPVSSGEGAIVLDPNAATGLSFNGTNTRLRVKGTVVVNSRTNGWNQYGQPVYPGTTPSNPYAIATSNNIISDPNQAFILARAVQVAGGVDTPENIKDYDDPVNNPSPLYAGMPVGPDPLRTLAVPRQSNTPSITNWTRQPAVSVGNGQTATLNPGIYPDIRITGGTVTFNPGMYILSPTGNNQGLRVSGGEVTGIGVMFYFTGSNYLDNGAGYWDDIDGALDGPLPPANGPASSAPSADNDPYLQANPGASVTYARVSVGGSSGTVTLEGMPYNTNDAADKTLFFYRRRNTTTANFGGGGSGNMVTSVQGTIYTKWAQFTLSGGRTYDSQFIVGSLVLAGGAEMTINATGINRGRANQVFLVE